MGDGRIVAALSFDALTPLYDLLCGVSGYGARLKHKVLDAARIRDGETVLDVGCGSGTLLLLAKRRYPGSCVIGIDPDEQILSIARAKLRRTDVDVELI